MDTIWLVGYIRAKEESINSKNKCIVVIGTCKNASSSSRKLDSEEEWVEAILRSSDGVAVSDRDSSQTIIILNANAKKSERRQPQPYIVICYRQYCVWSQKTHGGFSVSVLWAILSVEMRRGLHIHCFMGQVNISLSFYLDSLLSILIFFSFN